MYNNIIIDAQTEGEKIGDVHIKINKRMYVNTKNVYKNIHILTIIINYLLFTATM